MFNLDPSGHWQDLRLGTLIFSSLHLLSSYLPPGLDQSSCRDVFVVLFF